MLDRLIRITRFVLLTATCAAGLPAVAASFDCASASTRVEKFVCGDTQLSRMDEMLGSDYQAALSDVAHLENERLKREQRAWIARRNTCQDWVCVHQAYAKRIEEVRHVRCKRSGLVCPPQTALPRRADGRVVAYLAEDCRNNKPDVSVADCIEAGIYDPCDDADNDDDETRWWARTECGRAHQEVAERRIWKAEESALESTKKWQDAAKGLQEQLKLSGERWEADMKQFCIDRLQVDFGKALGEPTEYCMRRLTETRAAELERFATALRSAKTKAELDRFLSYLRATPSFAPPPRLN